MVKEPNLSWYGSLTYHGKGAQPIMVKEPNLSWYRISTYHGIEVQPMML